MSAVIFSTSARCAIEDYLDMQEMFDACAARMANLEYEIERQLLIQWIDKVAPLMEDPKYSWLWEDYVQAINEVY